MTDVKDFLKEIDMNQTDIIKLNDLLINLGYDLKTLKYMLKYDPIGFKKTIRRNKDLNSNDLVLFDKLTVYFVTFNECKNSDISDLKNRIDKIVRSLKEKYVPDVNKFDKDTIQEDKDICTNMMSELDELQFWKNSKTKSFFQSSIAELISCLTIIRQSEIKYIRNNAISEQSMYR
tara:strand:+ start:310 stop:837 length:528 start_codon:yes stop_codon:yes gene_type:complete